jgi:hypothetical protein
MSASPASSKHYAYTPNEVPLTLYGNSLRSVTRVAAAHVVRKVDLMRIISSIYDTYFMGDRTLEVDQRLFI